jgi:hypothetical protein
MSQVGQCPRESHKLRRRVRLPDLQLVALREFARRMAGYANRKSGEVESLVNLWVRLPPRSLGKNWSQGCWSNGKTPGLQPGDRGSIPRRSTQKKRKVAGYGWPGRFAKAVPPLADEGSTPLPSAPPWAVFACGSGKARKVADMCGICVLPQAQAAHGGLDGEMEIMPCF